MNNQLGGQCVVFHTGSTRNIVHNLEYDKLDELVQIDNFLDIGLDELLHLSINNMLDMIVNYVQILHLELQHMR